MDSSSGLSKSAKKNKKKREKKQRDALARQSAVSKEQLAPDPSELLEMMKKELEIAKAKQDHELAGKLREKIWVLTDLERGIRTEIEDNELSEILASLHLHKDGNATDAAAGTTLPHTKVVTTTASDGQLKKLYKKLEQIEMLKTRQTKGEKLEANQVEKIKKEAEIREEIAQLEEIILTVVASKS